MCFCPLLKPAVTLFCSSLALNIYLTATDICVWAMGGFKPVSNLPFLGKMIEWVPLIFGTPCPLRAACLHC